VFCDRCLPGLRGILPTAPAPCHAAWRSVTIRRIARDLADTECSRQTNVSVLIRDVAGGHVPAIACLRYASKPNVHPNILQSISNAMTLSMS
jgi:hypothetical protein